MDKVMVVLVGNIGSGKSTFTKALVDKDFIVVSRDRLRYAIGAGKYIVNPKYEQTIHHVHLMLLDNFMHLGCNLVVDSTNISKVARRTYIEMAHEHNYKVVAVELPRYSMEVSVTRRLSENHGTTTSESWEEIWERFDKRYQAPTNEEGFDHVIKINSDLPQSMMFGVIQEAVNGTSNL